MSTETLLDEALERIKPYISLAVDSDERDFNYRGPEDYNYFSGGASIPVARLRLDWEYFIGSGLPTDSDLFKFLSENRGHIATLLLDVIKADLLELIEDGDVDKYDDWLLKSFDGEKKRGKKASLVDIFSAQLYREFKPTKDTMEYTLFILMAVDWK